MEWDRAGWEFTEMDWVFSYLSSKTYYGRNGVIIIFRSFRTANTATAGVASFKSHIIDTATT